MNAPLKTEIPMEAVAKLCREYHVQELAIFGSALRPDFGPHSDIDLLVTFHPEARIGLMELCGLQAELSDLLGRNVDLVPKNGLKPLIREAVLSQAQVLYAA